MLSQSDFQHFIFRMFLIWWKTTRFSFTVRAFSYVEGSGITKLKYFLHMAWTLSSANSSHGCWMLDWCFLVEREGFFRDSWWTHCRLLLGCNFYQNLTATSVGQWKTRSLNLPQNVYFLICVYVQLRWIFYCNLHNFCIRSFLASLVTCLLLQKKHHLLFLII